MREWPQQNFTPINYDDEFDPDVFQLFTTDASYYITSIEAVLSQMISRQICSKSEILSTDYIIVIKLKLCVKTARTITKQEQMEASKKNFIRALVN